MKALNQQKTELFRNILFITLGSLLYALNFDLFLEPGGISSGGVSGIAIIIVYAAHPKFLTVGILNAMINISLFLCGLKKKKKDRTAFLLWLALQHGADVRFP